MSKLLQDRSSQPTGTAPHSCSLFSWISHLRDMITRHFFIKERITALNDTRRSNLQHGGHRPAGINFAAKIQSAHEQCSGSVSFCASQIRIRIHFYGSESLHPQAKNSERPWFLQFCALSLKSDINVPTVNKSKYIWHLASWKPVNRRSGSDPLSNGTDPDPYQSVTYPKHWFWTAQLLELEGKSE